MTESEPKWFLKKLIQRFLTNAILMKRIIVKKLVLKKSILVAARTPKRELQKGP